MTKQFTEFILVVESSSNGGPGISLRNHDSLQPSPIPSNSVQMSNTSTFTSRSSILSKSPNSSQRTGKFQLLGDVLTRFSDHCTNTVTQTSSVAKSEIQVISTSFFRISYPYLDISPLSFTITTIVILFYLTLGLMESSARK